MPDTAAEEAEVHVHPIEIDAETQRQIQELEHFFESIGKMHPSMPIRQELDTMRLELHDIIEGHGQPSRLEHLLQEAREVEQKAAQEQRLQEAREVEQKAAQEQGEQKKAEAAASASIPLQAQAPVQAPAPKPPVKTAVETGQPEKPTELKVPTLPRDTRPIAEIIREARNNHDNFHKKTWPRILNGVQAGMRQAVQSLATLALPTERLTKLQSWLARLRKGNR